MDVTWSDEIKMDTNTLSPPSVIVSSHCMDAFRSNSRWSYYKPDSLVLQKEPKTPCYVEWDLI